MSKDIGQCFTKINFEKCETKKRHSLEIFDKTFQSFTLFIQSRIQILIEFLFQASCAALVFGFDNILLFAAFLAGNPQVSGCTGSVFCILFANSCFSFLIYFNNKQ